MAIKNQKNSIFNSYNYTGVALKNNILKKNIIHLINKNKIISILDLSKELKISVPKTTKIIADLSTEGIVESRGKLNSTGGRRSAVYGLVANAYFFLGVEITKYFINLCIIDLEGQTIYIKEKLPFKLENTKNSLDEMINIINKFIKSSNIKREKILSMGICISGRVNNKTGYSYSYFHFYEEPLSLIIEQKLKITTFLENDSNAMVVGELHLSQIKNEKNILYINLDYGTGLGIIINGKLYYGKSGFSGEFGHIPIFKNEIICECGKKGCLQTEISGNALIRNIHLKINKGSNSNFFRKFKNMDIKLSDIVEAAKKDDTLIIELLAELGEKLGKSLAILINIFNPELLILGGKLAETGELLLLPTKTALNKYSLNLVNNDSSIILSNFSDKAGLIGTCLIAREKLLFENM